MFKKFFARIIPKSRSLWIAISLLLILALLFPIVQTLIQIRQQEAFVAITPQEHVETGIQYLEQEEYSLAFNEFNLAISKDSEFVEAYFERGKLLLLAGEPGLANANLSFTISHDPTNAEAYYYRALSYQELGELLAQASSTLEESGASIQLLDTGIFELDAVIELHADDLIPEIPLVEDVEIDQLQEAEIANYPEILPASQAVNPYNLALEDLSKAIEADVNYAEAYLARAYLLFGINDYLTVIDDLSHVIELTPETPIAYNMRALSY